MILEYFCWCWFCLSTTWGHKESDVFGFTLWIRTKMTESLRGCTENLLTQPEMQMIASSSTTGWLLRNLNIFTLCWNLNFTGRRQTFGSLFHLESGWPLHWGKFWFYFNSLFKCLKHFAFKTLRTSLSAKNVQKTFVWITKHSEHLCFRATFSPVYACHIQYTQKIYEIPNTQNIFVSRITMKQLLFSVEHLSGLTNKHSEHPCILMNPATTSCLPWNISQEYLHCT